MRLVQLLWQDMAYQNAGKMETLSETCNQCNCIDDENHRINYYPKWNVVNMYDSRNKIAYDDIYSNDIDKIRHVTACIEKIWNTRTAQGTMII